MLPNSINDVVEALNAFHPKIMEYFGTDAYTIIGIERMSSIWEDHETWKVMAQANGLCFITLEATTPLSSYDFTFKDERVSEP